MKLKAWQRHGGREVEAGRSRSRGRWLALLLAALWLAPVPAALAQATAPAPGMVSGTNPGIAAATAPAAVSITNLPQIIEEGRFAEALEALRQSGLTEANADARELVAHLERFEHYRQRQAEHRREIYEERMTTLAEKTTAGQLEDALDDAIEAHEHAADTERMLADQRVVTLIEKTIDAARRAEERGDWLEALSLYRDLDLLYEDHAGGYYKEMVERAAEHARILRMYAPGEFERMLRERARQRGDSDPEPLDADEASWQVRLEGVGLPMLQEALEDAARLHVNARGYRPLLRGAVARLEMLLATRGVEQVFPTLKNAGRAEAFRRELTRVRQELEQPGVDLTRQQAFDLVDRMLRANQRSVALPEEVLVYEMTEGAMRTLDEFSAVIWPYDRAEFSRSTEGRFFGVGIQITRNDLGPTVKSVAPGSPAAQAGLQAGDLILAVDDADAAKRRLPAVSQSLLEPAAEPVTVRLQRQTLPQPLEVTFTRGPGVELERTVPRLTVVSPLPGTPAHQAGIRPGDVIAAVDGQDATHWSLDRAVRSITGPLGTEVVLGIRRLGETGLLRFAVTRSQIDIESVKGWEYKQDGNWSYYIDPEHRIGYIRLSQFLPQSPQDLDDAINAMEQDQGVAALILDLRFNPGGLLNKCVEIANRFIPTGKIVSTVDRLGSETRPLFALPHLSYRQIPLVVLINQGSASASEIVSGALQDYERATIIGTRSYGKGSVQDLFPIGRRRAVLKLTTHYYKLPGERIIHRRPDDAQWGIDPDLPVRMTTQQITQAIEYRRDLDVLRDPNLPQAAGRPRLTAGQIIEKSLDPQLDAALILIKSQLLADQIKVAKLDDQAQATR